MQTEWQTVWTQKWQTVQTQKWQTVWTLIRLLLRSTVCSDLPVQKLRIITVSLWNMGAYKWAASSEFGTYRLCEQRRFRRACASAQSRPNLRCSLIQAMSQEEPSDRKPDPWPLWMAGHAQLKFFMTECSKTQIRLTRPKYRSNFSYRFSLSFSQTMYRIIIVKIKQK